MRIVALIAGIGCLVTILLDAFQTIILPRRAIGRFRITRIFYITTWGPWAYVFRHVDHPQKRETAFSFYGPLSLILLLAVWAGGMLLGFALMMYALGSPLNDPLHQPAGFISDIYASGTTIFTLGLGDVTPQSAGARVLTICEAGTGLGLLAVVVGYFPVLYAAFSRREVSIALLDARAGSPPTAAELMRRHAYQGANVDLTALLVEWERWSAELLESHISYPLLCYFRSQHNNQSWLSALTAILDTSALLIAGVRGHEARQAQLTFFMARHALADLAQIFSLTPIHDAPDRLPAERGAELYDLLCQSGFGVCRDNESLERLRVLRKLYEGHAEALSRYLWMPLPPWIAAQPTTGNWLTVSRLRAQAEAAGGQPQEKREAADIPLAKVQYGDQHHDF